MPNLYLDGNYSDPFRHVIVAKELSVRCKKSSKPLKSIQVLLNGNNIPVNLISSITNNGEQVQQLALHDRLHVFSNLGDSLTILIKYVRKKAPWKSFVTEELKMRESDIAGKEGQNIVVLSGNHFAISLFIKPGLLEDIMETVSLPVLDPLLQSRDIVAANDRFSKVALQLGRILASFSVSKPALHVLEKAIDVAGQTHPLAKALLTVLHIPCLMLKNKLQFTEDVKKLAEAILATYKILADARFSTKIASAVEVFATILATLRNAALYLELYNRRENLRKFLAAQFPQKLQEYTELLIARKNDFQTAMTIQIARDVDMLASLSVDEFLRKRLQPVEISVTGETCMVGTREGILREVEDWIKDRESKHDTLWIRGAPGAGKSTIVNSLVEMLNKSKNSCALFFCKRDKEDLRDPRRVWRTVAYQFADVNEGAKSALMSTLSEKENRWIKDSRPLDQFGKLVKDTLNIVGVEAKLYSSKRSLFVIVIDALDECYPIGDDRSDWDSLLSSLRERNELLTRGLWKIIVTSRLVTDIQDTLNDASHQITLSTGADVSNESNNDISKFFNAKFAKIRTDFRISSDWPGETSIAALTRYAGGLFIWAEMGVKYVGQRTAASKPRERLNEIISDIESRTGSGKEQWRMKVLEGGLDLLYGRIIYDAFRRSTAQERSDAKRILATVVLAMEPLRVRDLVDLFSTDDRITPESIDSTLRELSTVISVSPDEALRASHKTFSDFIQSYNNSAAALKHIVKDESDITSYIIDCGEEHKCMARACLSYARNMFLSGSSDIVEHLGTDLVLGYAFRYWFSHLTMAGNGCEMKSLSKAMEIASRCLARYPQSVAEDAEMLIGSLRDSLNFVIQHLEGARDTNATEDFRRELENQTMQLDAARGKFQVAAVLGRFKARDADTLLRSRLEPSNQSLLDDECLDGTRREVLQSVDKWLEDPTQKNVLWISGPPGAGKSTLATTLHKRISQNRYCVKVDAKRDFLNRRDPKCIWRTIAYQLAGLNAGLRGSIVEAASEVIQYASAGEQFRNIIQRAIEEQRYLFVVVIIDALDECSSDVNNDWRELLRTISSWPDLPMTLKLIVTSRDIQDIQDALGPVSLAMCLTAGADASDEAKADTALFLRRALEVNPPPWLTEALMQRAISFASGSFIYAKVLGRLVPSLTSVGDLEAILNGERFIGNDDIDLLYGKLLVATMGQLNEKERSISRSVLSTIVLAKDPLHKRDLVSLVPDVGEISCEAEASQLIQQTLSDLSAIISSVDGQPIRIPHKSFVDFFLDDDRSLSAMKRVLPESQNPRSYLLRFEEDSVSMAIACLRTMNCSLKFNVFGIESSFTLNEDIPELVFDCFDTGLLYACRFWIQHLDDGKESKAELRAQLQPALKTLFAKNFLYWLEVLSATKAVDVAQFSATTILRYVDDDELKDLTRDAIQLTWTSNNSISQSNPHIYLSVLAFCPKDSRISQIYGAQYPRLLSHNTTSNYDWLDGDATDAAFLNGEKIVVASGRKVFVWDSKRRMLVCTLSGHRKDISCFSVAPEGKRIATGSLDGTFRIWDSNTGQCLLPLEPIEPTPQKRIVWAMVFTLDESQVVIGFEDDVEVRNVSDGRLCLGPLRGHTGNITCIALSPDGHYIASGSNDSTIRVWDAKRAGEEVQLLTAHTAWVHSNCIAFSPNGKYLATGSHDQTIRIWNVAQGFAENDVTEIAGPVFSLSFSPNSEYLASASDNGVLLLWSVGRLGTLKKVGQLFDNPNSRIFIILLA